MSNKNLITFNGETKSITGWSDCTGLSRQTIYNRLAKGWPLADVFDPKLRSPGRPNVKRTVPAEQERFQFSALNLLYEDMKAHQRTLHRSILAFVRSVEDQFASQRLTVERMLEERTALPADIARGEVPIHLKTSFDRTLPSAQETPKLEKSQ